jgi:hypothetical protein
MAEGVTVTNDRNLTSSTVTYIINVARTCISYFVSNVN